MPSLTIELYRAPRRRLRQCSQTTLALVKQTDHAEIVFLCKMKSEKLVVELRSNDIEEFDLPLDVKPSAVVVDLLSRQACFLQEWRDLDAFL